MQKARRAFTSILGFVVLFGTGAWVFARPKARSLLFQPSERRTGVAEAASSPHVEMGIPVDGDPSDDYLMDQRAYEDAMSSATPARTLIWTLMTGYVVWFFVTFTKGVGAAHRLGVARAATAGSVGVIVYQLVFVIFNR